MNIGNEQLQMGSSGHQLENNETVVEEILLPDCDCEKVTDPVENALPCPASEPVEAEEAKQNDIQREYPPEDVQGTIVNTFKVLEQVDHDATSFTQGLSYGDGKIYETTGLYGQSKVRRINPATFAVELSVDADSIYFCEGSTFYTDADGNGRLIMITWQEQTGFIYDPETLQQLKKFEYSTTAPGHQGWGITYDASNAHFVVSDGSKYLYFWDRDTLEEKRKVAVTRFDGREQDRLNELEYMDGLVCCNIWYSDDMSSLWPEDERNRGADVLNGIALGNDHVLITGKKWDRIFKVAFPDWPTLFSPDMDEATLDNIDDQTDNNDNVNNSDEGDTSAVSYNFLRTTKGSQTIRLLLDDLLQKTSIDEDHLFLSGPRRALTHLSELMESDGQILSSCHPLAHNLGRAAYQYFGGLDEAYDGMLGTEDAHLLRLCNAAYLHGVIEFHLRDVDDVDNLASAAREIEEKVCSNLINVNKGPWECHHGIGHGIIQRHRLDAERNIILKGINTCNETAAAAECENGMWMDHFAVSGNILAMETRMMAADVVVAQLKEALSSLDVNQQEAKYSSAIAAHFQLPPLPPTLQICRLGAAFQCLNYAATEYLLVHPGDYIGALQYCTDPSANINPSETNECIFGVGSQVAKENMNDLSILEEACQTLGDEPDASWLAGIPCFRAGLSYYMMSSGDRSPSEAGLCDKLTRYKQICNDYQT
ncbi:hypothetical protein ACHAXR_007046 [Thalassiosira sp. AJA248-18]